MQSNPSKTIMHSSTKDMKNHQEPAKQGHTNYSKGQISCIAVFNHKQWEPITQVTQPKVQQITNNLPSPCKENTRKQPTQVHPDPTPVRKSPLLHTLPAQSRQTFIPGPSTFNSSRKPTFARPSVFNNNRFHQQPFITRPSLIYNTVHQQPYTPRPFTINRYHYCHYHHTRFQHFQDHSNRHQDTTYSKYITYQFYYHTCHNITPHRTKKTEEQRLI